MIDDVGDDTRRHWKKWRRNDDLAFTVNDAAPCFMTDYEKSSPK